MTEDAICTGIVGLEGMVCNRRFGVEAVGEGGRLDRVVTGWKRKPCCKVGRGRGQRATCSKDSVTRSKDLLRQCELALVAPRTVAMVTGTDGVHRTRSHSFTMALQVPVGEEGREDEDEVR